MTEQSRKNTFGFEYTSIIGKDNTAGTGNTHAVLVNNAGGLKVDSSAGSVPQGASTEAKQDDAITKLTSIDNKMTRGNDDTIGTTALQVLNYGRIDNATADLKAMKCSNDGTLYVYDASVDANTNRLTSINDKMSQGADATLASAFQSLVYGRSQTTQTVTAIRCSEGGDIITAPQHAGIITSDGITTEQRTLINGNYNGNLRTLKCGANGALATELDHSWTTSTILSPTALADGATISATYDLGQGISHEPDGLTLFVTNSASVSCNAYVEVSYDGTNWYKPVSMQVPQSSEPAFAINNEDMLVSKDNRYYRFTIENGDGQGTSTNIGMIIGLYR